MSLRRLFCREKAVPRELWGAKVGTFEGRSIIDIEKVGDKLYRKCRRVGDECWIAWRLIIRLRDRIDEKNRVIEAYAEMLEEEKRRNGRV